MKTPWAFTYLLRFLALLGFCSVSYAQGAFSGVSGSTCYPTPAAYCQTLIPSNPPSDWSNIHLVNTNNGQCNIAGNFLGISLWYTNPQYFPCVPPTPSPTPTPTPDLCKLVAGKVVGDSKSTLTYPIGTTFEGASNIGCMAGCKVLPSEIATGKNPLGQEIVFARGPFLNVGEKCDAEGSSSGSPSGTPAPTPPPLHDEPSGKSCEKPKCPGEVNGQTICVQCDARKTTDEKKEEKTQEDGSKTETTTKEETVCTGEKCTTTTTTITQPKDANGIPVGAPVTKTDKKEEDADSFCLKNPRHKQCSETNDFCKQNPDLQVCKNGTYSDTSCDSAPSCTGDPVQCAQAANAFKTYCETKKTAEALYGSGAGLDDAQSSVNAAISFGSGSLPLVADAGTVGIGSFDQSNPWGSTCVADADVAVFEGKTITVPFSKYCGIFEIMGRISIAGTLLLAGLFVFKE